MNYEISIGLEVHAELSTNTKIFCGCTTAFGGEENTHCCPICLGLPGALPKMNMRAVEYAVKTGLALDCTIAAASSMSRKHYFYPDSPKGFQITQHENPIAAGGYLDIEGASGVKRIDIERVHLEEDAGKLIHIDGCTLVDYNRAGVPLIEIVSAPEINSPHDAVAFLEKLRILLKYLGVSDCRMEEGSLRCDANVSLRPRGSTKLGTRVEIKNMNSFKALERALEYEGERQIKLLEEGKDVIQETRRWDEQKRMTAVMRGKEEAHDYRYFEEPDLAAIRVDQKWISQISQNLPEHPDKRKKRFIAMYKLPEYDALILTSERELADFFEECAKIYCGTKTLSNWIMGELMRMMNESQTQINSITVKPSSLVSLLKCIDDGIISGTMAKKVFEEMFKTGREPSSIIKEEGFSQNNDVSLIRGMVLNVLAENKSSVEDIKAGREKAFGFLVGQVMKASGGRANPSIVNKILREELA